jgi:outer membrane protein OmpA-like peptidoglycan-associated protein
MMMMNRRPSRPVGSWILAEMTGKVTDSYDPATLDRATESRGTLSRATDNRGTLGRGTEYAVAPLESKPPAGLPGSLGVGMEHVTIYFDQNKDAIRSDQVKELKKISTILKDPNSKAVLVGHASTEGKPKDNFKLSQRRVDAVKKFLVNAGISEGSLSTEAMGERMPRVEEKGLTPEDIEQKRAQNRRVEIDIIRQDPTRGLSPGLKEIAGRALVRHREAIDILTKRRKEFEEREEKIRTAGEGGPVVVYLQEEIDTHRRRIEKFRRNLEALEKAVAGGDKAVREWYRQRDLEAQDDLKSNTEWLEDLEKRREDARQEFEHSSPERKSFWGEVMDLYAAYIEAALEERKTILEGQKTDLELQRKQRISAVTGPEPKHAETYGDLIHHLKKIENQIEKIDRKIREIRTILSSAKRSSFRFVEDLR